MECFHLLLMESCSDSLHGSLLRTLAVILLIWIKRCISDYLVVIILKAVLILLITTECFSVQLILWVLRHTSFIILVYSYQSQYCFDKPSQRQAKLAVRWSMQCTN